MSYHTLLYGNDTQALKITAQSRVSPTPLVSKRIEVTNGSYVLVTRVHHEFDIMCCYNNQCIADYMQYINEIASMKRIDSTRHIICIHNIHALKPGLLSMLKCMLHDYFNRTEFILTTTKVSYIGKSIASLCALVRVPGDQGMTPSIIATTKLQQLLDCPCPSHTKVRETAYSFIIDNVPFVTLARAIILHFSRSGPDTDTNIPDIIALLAQLESYNIKKDVMSFELALHSVLTHLKPRQ